MHWNPSTSRLRHGLLALASLLALPAHSALAAFPGDNGLIAFSNYDPGQITGQVATLVVEEEGKVTPLTTEGLLNDVPAWSPDGTRIAFYSTRDLNREIYVMNADGSDQVRLTDHSSSDYLPSWLSDGQSLFFASNRDGDYEIYRMSVTGGVPRKITDNTSDDILAQASPSCGEVVFVSNRDGDYELFKMDVYGRDQTQITFNTQTDLYPDWSPDGMRIVFASERETSIARDVWIMNADGSDPENIVRETGSDTDPAFSPDGTMLAWSSNRGTLGSIFVAPLLDMDSPVEVSASETKDRLGPDWQPLEPAEGFPSPECEPLIICGDATTDFDITASDALHILRAAVGQPLACGRPRCDADDGGSVAASDAQRVLRFSVGQNVSLDCPLPVATLADGAFTRRARAPRGSPRDPYTETARTA